MRVAVTGATGFLGRYVVARLTAAGHRCKCWYRPSSDLSGIDTRGGVVTWVEGQLGDPRAEAALVSDCDAVVHAALDRPGREFRGGEGELIGFVERNLLGTLRLIEASRRVGVIRFVFVSTCAVHETILPDRPLDETHPLWPHSHYGAHKAAIEAFVQSYGKGETFPICALRPTGIYGLAHPARASKWFDLVRAVSRGAEVECRRGGKEVHAADVARAVELLLNADARAVTGEAFACYDMYIAEHDVATIARDLSGSKAIVLGQSPTPRNQIDTDKIRALGMTFGGRALLEATVGELLAAARKQGG